HRRGPDPAIVRRRAGGVQEGLAAGPGRSPVRRLIRPGQPRALPRRGSSSRLPGMDDGQAYGVVGTARVVAAVSRLMALLGRPPRLARLVGLSLVALVMVLYAVLAMGKMFTGERPDAVAAFVGYLLTAVLIPPLGALLGWAERTRWGSLIISVTCLVVPIMVVRLQQVWGVWDG